MSSFIKMLSCLYFIFLNAYSQEYTAKDLNKRITYSVPCVGSSFIVDPTTFSTAQINGDQVTGSWNGKNLKNVSQCHGLSYQKYMELKKLNNEKSDELAILISDRDAEISKEKVKLAAFNAKEKKINNSLKELKNKHNSQIDTIESDLEEKADAIISSSSNRLSKLLDIDIQDLVESKPAEEVQAYLNSVESKALAIIESRNNRIDEIYGTANFKKNSTLATNKAEAQVLVNDLEDVVLNAISVTRTIAQIALNAERKIKVIMDELNAKNQEVALAQKNPSPIIVDSFESLQKELARVYGYTCSFEVEMKGEERDANCRETYSEKEFTCHCDYSHDTKNFKCARKQFSTNIEDIIQISGEYEIEGPSYMNIWNTNKPIYSAEGKDIPRVYNKVPAIVDFWMQKQFGKVSGFKVEDAVVRAVRQNPNVNWDCDQCEIYVEHVEGKYDRREYREHVLAKLNDEKVAFMNYNEFEERDLELEADVRKDAQYVSSNNLKERINVMIHLSRSKDHGLINIGWNSHGRKDIRGKHPVRRAETPEEKRKLEENDVKMDQFFDAIEYAEKLSFYSNPDHTYSDFTYPIKPKEELNEKEWEERQKDMAKRPIVVQKGASLDEEDKEHDIFFGLFKRGIDPKDPIITGKGNEKGPGLNDEGKFIRYKKYSYDKIIIKCKKIQEIDKALKEDARPNPTISEDKLKSQKTREKNISSTIKKINDQIITNETAIKDAEETLKNIKTDDAIRDEYKKYKKEVEKQFTIQKAKPEVIEDRILIQDKSKQFKKDVIDEIAAKKERDRLKREEEERKRREEQERKKNRPKKGKKNNEDGEESLASPENPIPNEERPNVEGSTNPEKNPPDSKSKDNPVGISNSDGKVSGSGGNPPAPASKPKVTKVKEAKKPKKVKAPKEEKPRAEKPPVAKKENPPKAAEKPKEIKSKPPEVKKEKEPKKADPAPQRPNKSEEKPKDSPTPRPTEPPQKVTYQLIVPTVTPTFTPSPTPQPPRISKPVIEKPPKPETPKKVKEPKKPKHTPEELEAKRLEKEKKDKEKNAEKERKRKLKEEKEKAKQLKKQKKDEEENLAKQKKKLEEEAKKKQKEEKEKEKATKQPIEQKKHKEETVKPPQEEKRTTPPRKIERSTEVDITPPSQETEVSGEKPTTKPITLKEEEFKINVDIDKKKVIPKTEQKVEIPIKTKAATVEVDPSKLKLAKTQDEPNVKKGKEKPKAVDGSTQPEKEEKKPEESEPIKKKTVAVELYYPKPEKEKNKDSDCGEKFKGPKFLKYKGRCPKL